MDEYSKRKIRVFITKRDKALFNFLYMFKIASREQIHKTFFPNVTTQAVSKRLRVLREVNLIKTVPLEAKNGTFKKAFSLTPKAFKDFINTKNTNLRKELQSDAKEHDIRLGNIYLGLKNYKEVTHYYSENLLQAGLIENEKVDLKRLSENGHDAIFLLNKKQDLYYPVAIEYEHSCKTIKRYHRFFSKVYTTPRLEGVYYICKDQSLLDKVLSIDKKYYGDLPVKIYYQLYDEVTQEKDSLIFFSKTNSTSTLTKKYQDS